MSCYHPMKAFYVKKWNKSLDLLEYDKTENNKSKLYVTDYHVKYIYMTKDGVWHKSYDDFKTKLAVIISDEFIEIPCGKCIGCRLDQSAAWSQRCMLEAQYHDSNYFLTITYDDEHLPKSEYTDENTGEVLQFNTLVKRDWQLFIKALRRRLETLNRPPVRFFMCGEYGTTTLRPHYHAIIFGLVLDDLVPYKRTSRGDVLYNSPFLDDIWKKGYIVVGSVTPESCGYTARYCTKKAYQSNDVYLDHNIQPEFTLMSRRPGIAKQYFDDHPNLYDDDYIYLSTDKGGMRFKPPRYFDKLAELNDPDFFIEDKFYSEYNHISDDYKKGVLDDTSLGYLEYLETAEKVKESQIKALQRKL